MSEPYRKYAVASVEVFPAGRAEPVVTDRGLGLYDRMEDVYENGKYTRGPANTLQYYFSQLVYIKDLGLTCRSFWRPQDTLISHFNLSGDTFSERKPAVGYRKSFLVQHSAKKDLKYSATSKSSLPENPHFAFTIALAEVPTGWNFITIPPYVRVEFGNGAYGIHFQGGNIYLVKWTEGRWVQVEEISANVLKDGSQVVWVQCFEGKIWVSTDFGKEYTPYGSKDPKEAITVSSGPLVLRGQGGKVSLRVDQLWQDEGTFRAPRKNIFTRRNISPTSTITGKSSTPYGSSISISEESNTLIGEVGYSVRMTPRERLGGFGWNFYTPPVLRGVSFRYPVETFTLLENPSTPWDKYLLEVTVDKTLELSGSTCTLRFHRSSQTLFTGNYDRRKINVKLGWKMSDGTVEWEHQSYWYIRTVNPKSVSAEYQSIHVEVIADNVSCRLKETTWDVFSQYHLGGNQLNDVNSHILYTEGMGEEYGDWFSNNYSLDEGTTEEPYELTKAQESKWETISRINKVYGFEVGTTDGGTFRTVPITVQGEPWSTGVIHELKLRPDAGDQIDIRKLVANIEVSSDVGESVSAVLVYGTGVKEQAILAYAVDTISEDPVLGPQLNRFMPWRRTFQKEVEGKSTVEALTVEVMGLAYDKFVAKKEPSVSVPVNLNINRRDEVSIKYADGYGVEQSDTFVVMSVRINFKARTALSELRTDIGLKKKNKTTIGID